MGFIRHVQRERNPGRLSSGCHGTDPPQRGNPQALIHHYPHISRDLEELMRQGLLRMDGARVYSAKVFAAECVAAANLAHRLCRLMKAVE